MAGQRRHPSTCSPCSACRVDDGSCSSGRSRPRVPWPVCSLASGDSRRPTPSGVPHGCTDVLEALVSSRSDSRQVGSLVGAISSQGGYSSSGLWRLTGPGGDGRACHEHRLPDPLFSLEVNAPASRTHEHCREWVRAGHDVTMVTCVPNHPSGRVYPGYCNLRGRLRASIASGSCGSGRG
jgi:hypothetical protein